MKAIQSVISNLSLSKIEARTDLDPDLLKYSKHREIDPLKVNSSIAVEPIDLRLTAVLEILLDRVSSTLCLDEEFEIMPRSIRTLTYDSIRNVAQSFKKNYRMYEEVMPDSTGRILLMLSNLQSLIFGRRLLLEQGVPSFREYFLKFIEVVVQDIRRKQENSDHIGDQVRKELLQKTELREIVDAVRLTNLRNGVHPKMLKLHQILTTFFSSDITLQEESKVIVFTQSRVSAKELQEYLSKKSVVIRAAMFVGQANRFGQKGMNQEEQQEVIRKLKSNELNLIIATSVAEEGLDIGEVDLIVCFDSGLSPIRLVQRMGRTGRQRRGRVILLLMENEFAVYQASTKRYREIMNTLQSPPKSLLMYSFSPRMIPADITPKLYYQEASKVFETETHTEDEEADEKINNLINSIVQHDDRQAKNARLNRNISSEIDEDVDIQNPAIESRDPRVSTPMSDIDKLNYESKLVTMIEEKERSVTSQTS